MESRARMTQKHMQKLYNSLIRAICRISFRHPALVLVVAVVTCLLAVLQLNRLRLDANLLRLLSEDNRVVLQKDQIRDIVTGSGGYFTILLGSEDREKVLSAFHAALERVQKLEEVEAVEYQNPRDFIKKYGCLLLSMEDLDRVLESLLKLEAQFSPMGDDLLSENTSDTKEDDRGNKREIKRMVRYLDLPQYHQSEDGQTIAIKIYPTQGISNIGDISLLSRRLESLLDDIRADFEVWGGLTGSLKNDLKHYSFILHDLARSGLIMAVMLGLALFIGFRGVRAIPIILLPLGIGLVLAFGTIPLFAKSLNTITSFLMLVSFGLGIDFSIHLLKRFMNEWPHVTAEEALVTTFVSTGRSVLVSGFTTALALFVLAFSNFRGFSEFGIIGGYSILVVLLSVMIFLPAILSLGIKIRLLKPDAREGSRVRIPGKMTSLFLWVVILAALIIGGIGLRFDFDFSQMDVDVPQEQEVQDRFHEVYESRRSPGALFVAKGLPDLDNLLNALEQSRTKNPQSQILKYESIRSLSPDVQETQERLALIAEIKESISGRWIKRVEDPDYQKLISEIRDWVPPSQSPEFEELPETFTYRLISQRYAEHYIIPVYIRGKKQNGKDAADFANELYDLEIPSQVVGPFGDTTIIAEVMEIVTQEGPWLIIFTFVGIFLLILGQQRSFSQTLWIVMPLATGMALMSGLMVVFGLSLNFFNIVVFPTLIGIGIDDGVHYYRRWREMGGDTLAVQKELFGTLSLTTATTICSYLGIALSRHPGLRSIGLLACLGLICTWVTTLFLLPGMLILINKRRKG